MSDVRVSQKGASGSDGNMRKLGDPVMAGRDPLPFVYPALQAGDHYLYNLNLFGSAGDKVLVNFKNATPSSVTYVLPGDPGGAGQMNRDILLLVL